MWALGTLLGLWLVLWAAAIPGFAIAELLPWRQRPGARLYLSPLLGLSVLVLVATGFGWFAKGFRLWYCLPCTLLPAAAIAVLRPKFLAARLPTIAAQTVFFTVASFPVLCPLWRFGCYSPFNDTFTYLVQAQWLQTHGFVRTVIASPFQPAWLQVLYYQQTGLRMGASFLLGWLQAVFGLGWSYEIFPLAAALGLASGALAAGGLVNAVSPRNRRGAWLVALSAAVSVDGFAFGAVLGFLPQTFGLAFVTAALVLRGQLMQREFQGRPAPGWTAQLPLALACAAAIYCYSEAAPFLIAAMGLSYLLPWPGDQAAWRQRLFAGLTLAGLVFAFVNAEWLRIARALRSQSGALVGNPVAWQWWVFPAHALGIKTGIWENGRWAWHRLQPHPHLPAFLAVTAALWLLSRDWRRGKTGLRASKSAGFAPLLPTAGLIALFAVAFIYFRYLAKDPWPAGLGDWAPGKGQSWNQFKLSNWASLALIGTSGAALYFLAGKARLRPVLSVALCAWCAVGIIENYYLSDERTNDVRRAAGAEHDPFAAYISLRALLTAIPKTDLIYLRAAPGQFKHMQLLVYFLSDFRLVGDWRSDPGCVPEWLPPSTAAVAPESCDWMLHFDAAAAPESFQSSLPDLCRVLFEPCPRRAFSLARISGGYDSENAEIGWMDWTTQRLDCQFKCHSIAYLPHRFRFHCAGRSAVGPQTIDMQLGSGGGKIAASLTFGDNTREYVSPWCDFTGGDVSVSLSSQSAARVVSPSDARPLNFMIQNAWIECE